MIKIRYTPPKELDIAFDEAGLADLCEVIHNINESGVKEYTLSCGITGDCHPFDMFLDNIIVRLTDGMQMIAVKDNSVIISGDDRSLVRLLSYFNTLEPGQHNHHEYFEGDEFIEPESIPTVVSYDK